MPLVFQKQIDNQSRLGLWKIEENETDLVSSLQLKAHEIEMMNSLNHGKRLLHWLSTRVLLRTMLQTQYYIDCQIDEHGKPFLPNSNFHISLSHSYDYAAVIISEGKQVGVDIELIKHKIKSIKHKFLSDLELAQKNVGDNTQGLYVCWCAKEAVYKWYGKKGIEFKQHIHIKPFKLKDAGELQVVVELPEGQRTLQVHYFQVPEAYMLAYVVE